MADDGFTFTIDGQTFDFADLTLGEVEELEAFADEAFSLIDYSRAAILVRVAWYFLRRDTTSLTLDDVRAKRMSILRTPAPVEDAEERPTPPVTEADEATA